ncbi:MAG: Asp-tRNA(Asn)/Glu-tRNA(Gln) amidotransferase subunit GatA [Anaerolineales bacterium]|nr:Asp-tRNA(Asn)/Glu-tRNA(Gln) amidotransferase subunit GatA [Anaerolineales bacterium]
MDINSLTITQTSQLLDAGQISPLELLQAYLQRIEKIEPLINCFITQSPENALTQAKKCKQAPKLLNPLCGIPVAIKDLFYTKDIRTTMGSRFYTEYLPEENARVIELLYGTGIVCVGKTNMHEIALGITNINPHYGVCRNPWDTERITGGSSGGSAAALAAGLCLAALGSDTGGSIRIPASLCGVVGLKPTYGRVSLTGVYPLSWSLDHAGPMARCVEDIAALLQIMAGYDAQDPVSVNIPVENYSSKIKQGVRNCRIALASDAHFSNAEEDVLNAVRDAARVFEQLGATVEEVDFPGGHEAATMNGLIVTNEASVVHARHMREHPDWFGEDVYERLQKGAAYTAQEYIQAKRAQATLRRQFEQFFSNYDILLTATTPITAPLIDQLDNVKQAPVLTRFTAPFNLTGLPALSLPCGFSVQGLPIGLQIVSQPWAETTIFRAAYAYQQATPWHLKHPDLD